MFAYCGNNPIIRSDSGGASWQELWEAFRDALSETTKQASGVFAVGIGATQVDSPAPGLGDAVGLSKLYFSPIINIQ